MSGNKRKQYSILKKTAGFYFLKQFFFYFFIAVFLSSIIDGCSPVGRYKALSFFFDGVPNPDFVAGKDSTGGNLISGQPVAVKSTGPEFYFHPPYGRNECARCHDNEAIGMLKAAVPVLCYRCHSDFRNSYDFLHGPVGAGYCLMCHQHHSSEYEKLLVKSGQE
ncbi:MAG: hypothetical protein HYY40_01660, partial [Bacteroidetes bacterium]|nr:hypothetical protein [Bacteroidota bacterium]